jgi:hypothetical protein
MAGLSLTQWGFAVSNLKTTLKIRSKVLAETVAKSKNSLKRIS